MLKKLCLPILFFLLLIAGEVQAQTYTIPDANFRTYLVNNIPSVVNASQQLVIANAKNYTGAISCQGLNIQNISGLQYFHKVYLINCSNNQLTSIPSLDSLLLLKQLWIFNNKISALPKINHLLNLEVLNIKNNLLSSVPSLEGMTSLKELDCSLNNLNALPELNSLVNLEDFFCYSNSLTTIPVITNLTMLKILNVERNKLVSLPDFSQNVQLRKFQFSYNQIDSIPPVSQLTLLTELIFSGNKITSLPDLSSNTQLMLIFGEDNRLTEFPDLSGFTNLAAVKMQHNQLSFEQMMPSAMHPQFTTVFGFQPQDTIEVNKTIEVIKGAPYQIELDIDESVSGSTYLWHLNNVQVNTSTAPTLSFNAADESQEGIYSVSITNSNPKLNGITINVRAGILKVAPCITASTINYRILTNDCVKGATIQIDNSSIIGSNTPFTFDLLPLQNQKTISSQSPAFENVMPGSYTLIIKDTNDCSISFQNYMYIPAPSGCTESFTPNGDGVEDVYFISKIGTAKIYNKNGVLMQTLNVPSYWDGMDTSGKLVPMGYYIILINGKEKTGVVVID